MNELIPSGIVGDTTSLEPLYPTAIEPTITSRPDEIVVDGRLGKGPDRSEEHTSELQSLMRISYAVFCLKKKKIYNRTLTAITLSTPLTSQIKLEQRYHM